MRRASAIDRAPTLPVFELNVTLPGLKAAGGKSDIFRVSSETRSATERDEAIRVVKHLASIPRWDVLLARIANRFTTREMVRAAGPGGESLDELLERTAPVVEAPRLNRQIEPYLAQPTRSGAPRKAEGVHKVKMQLERFVEFLGGPEVALVSDLNDDRINAFLKQLSNKRNGAKADGKTVNRYRAAISGLASYCQRRKLLTVHPLREGTVTKHSEKGGARMPDWFGSEHYRVYLEAVGKSSPRLVTFFRLLLSTGVDLEELLHLRVSDISFGDAVNTIATRRLKVDTPARTIPFPLEHAGALKAHIAEYGLKPDNLLYGMIETVRTKSGVSCYEVIAAHRAGRLALGYTTAHEASKHGIKRVGTQSLRLKDLRHVAAIAWVRGGVKIEQVQYYLGHTSLSQTQVYTRYRPNGDEHLAAVRAHASAFDEE